MTFKKGLLAAAYLIAVPLLTQHANADWKPTQDIEIVVPNAPGGGNDLLARAVGNLLTQEKLVPTSVAILNKPGGAQAVGVAYAAANRAGNPHTLVLVSTGTQVTPLMVDGAKGYKDLQPIATLTVDDFFLVVDAKSKYKDVVQMVAAAKEKPRSVSIGIGGATDEMAVADLEAGTGVKFNIVRFGSTGESLNALLGGHVDATTGNPVELLPQIKAGAVRGVAVFRDTRFDVAPDVPTLAEQGIKVPTYQAWRGIAAPKGITPEQLAYWQGVFKKVGESQAFKDMLKKNVSTGMILTGDAMQKYTDEQEALYKSLMGK